ASPDVIVVAAYGKILRQSLLDIPARGCINIHASLLPKYRGAAPIQWAIINGEKETGVTTMMMDAGLDTGDMLLKKAVEIGEHETAEELSDRLAKAGGELIIETLKRLEAGDLPREKQNDSETGIYARMLKKTDGQLDLNKPAGDVDRQIRGLYSWPCAYTRLQGKTLKIIKAHVADEDSAEAAPGTITNVTKKTITVQCSPGLISIDRVQPEGKKPMDTAAFLAGNRIEPGMVMEQEDNE
ncbi:MAG: methionyl-tRNA formyltransferase, partial [Lachnospiraceae bacterium]|nr:methionyl-tRNA formyltransferase [Lachnospiraceae bacterium]